MPCYDDRPDIERKQTKEKLDKATKAACELARFIDNLEYNGGNLESLSKETQNWIKEHKEMDKRTGNL